MATITIRRLDDTVKGRLRVRAAQHGRSMEEEAREILTLGVQAPTKSAAPGKELNWVDEIRRHFEPLGGIDLDIPAREPMRDPPDFSGWLKTQSKPGKRAR
ncbi:MAG: plasmid stabilization protein [Acidobacteriota bacterium]